MVEMVKTLFRSVILAMSSLFIATSLLVYPAQAEQVDVFVDEAKLLRLDEPVAKIILGNPAMADVSVQSNVLLVLTGKGYGTTNLILLNHDGETIRNIRVSVNLSRNHTVSVRKGTERYSFHCSQGAYCNGTAAMGDNAKFFKSVNTFVKEKYKLAKEMTKGN